MIERKHSRGKQAPKDHVVDAGPVSWNIHVSQPEVTLIKADSIRVERSPKARFLPLKSGDVQVYSTVEISVSGKWFELTKECSADFDDGSPI